MVVRCCLPLRRAVTVVIVSWESLELIEDSIAAVRRFSPPGTRIIVVDNASTDGSIEWLRSQPVRLISLHANFGHGLALDLGVLAARTRTIVALDVDAFPIAADWLEKLEAGFAAGATVSGAHGGWVLDQHTEAHIDTVPDEWKYRDFVHPCCLAMRLRRFVWRCHSFRGVKRPDRVIDPAERISEREHGRLHYLEPTSIRGPGALGTVFADCVYHNFYGVRHRRATAPTSIDGISVDESRRAWDEAVASYLRAT